MRRLLLHSTLVLVVLLLSAAASHAEELKANVLLAEQNSKEDADLHDEGEEDEEGRDEAESEGPEQKDKGDVSGASSRTVVTNAPQSSSSKDMESPDDAKKQREMALRVRELLSRLPIIPLSQSPVLHKETLVAAAPVVASGVSDDPAAAVVSIPPTASRIAGSLVLRDPADPAHAARIVAPHPLDKSAFVADDLTDERVQTASPAASVTAPLYGGRPGTQEFPVAFGAGEQDYYQVSEGPVPYFERPDDAVEGPVPRPGPQLGKGYPSLADVSHGDLNISETQHGGAPAEFAQLFGIMNALSALVDWIENVKQELNSREAYSRPAGGDEAAEEKSREDVVTEKETGRENTVKKQGGEEVAEDTEEEKGVKKSDGGYKALRFGHHQEN